MGYAWLLQDTQGENIVPARAGQLNPQTTWVFERLQLEPPVLLPDASPRFESIAHRLNTTTTERDHQAAKRLIRWAFIGGSVLEGETLESFGGQILHAGASLTAHEPDEIVSADFKRYEAGGLKFGISQLEVTNFAQLEERLTEIRTALAKLRDSKGLNFTILMATNVVEGSSRLILTDDIPMLDVLPYPRRDDGTRSAESVVSRKKQLLPLVLGALEG